MHPKTTPLIMSLHDINAEKLRKALSEIPIMATTEEVNVIRAHQEAKPKFHKAMNRHQRRKALAKARRAK